MNSGRIARIRSRRPIRWFIREWRLHRGLSQQQVADRLDTSVSQVSSLETGKRSVDERWLAGLAEAFDIEPDMLMRDPDAPSPQDMLRNATREQKERIIEFIEFTLKRA